MPSKRNPTPSNPPEKEASGFSSTNTNHRELAPASATEAPMGSSTPSHPPEQAASGFSNSSNRASSDASSATRAPAASAGLRVKPSAVPGKETPQRAASQIRVRPSPVKQQTLQRYLELIASGDKVPYDEPKVRLIVAGPPANMPPVKEVCPHPHCKASTTQLEEGVWLCESNHKLVYSEHDGMSSPLLAWDDIVQLPVKDFAGTECKIDKIKADQVAGAFGELAEQHLSADFYQGGPGFYARLFCGTMGSARGKVYATSLSLSGDADPPKKKFKTEGKRA